MYAIGAASFLTLLYGGLKYFKTSENKNKEKINKKYDYNITPTDSFMVRLSGRAFTKATKNIKKQFNYNFVDAMLYTARDLLNEFQPSSVFTQSDEIIMVFPAQENNNVHLYGGNISKICSSISAFASVKFTNYIYNSIYSQMNENHDANNEIKEDNNESNDINYEFIFVANIISVSEEEEISEILYWNSFKDGYRNCINMILKDYCEDDYSRLNTQERLEKLKEYNFDFDTIPNYIKYGWIIKNENVCFVKNDTEFYRKKPVAYSFDIIIKKNIDYSDGKLFTDKLWNNYIQSFETINLDDDIKEDNVIDNENKEVVTELEEIPQVEESKTEDNMVDNGNNEEVINHDVPCVYYF